MNTTHDSVNKTETTTDGILFCAHTTYVQKQVQHTKAHLDWILCNTKDLTEYCTLFDNNQFTFYSFAYNDLTPFNEKVQKHAMICQNIEPGVF